METRSNHLMVGAVVLALLAAVVAFIIWLSQVSANDNKEYDVFFAQAVDGLATGSSVSFSGVPVGQVKSINLQPNTPQFVRVRISVRQETPILQGTTASVQGVGFTGVSQIQLEPASPPQGRGEQVQPQPRRQPPPITCREPVPNRQCPYGVPVIPTRAGGLAAVLSSAPVLLERITSLTERLTDVLSDRNQNSIAAILENVQQISRALADRSPEIAATLVEARLAIRETGEAVDEIGQLANTTNRLLAEDGRPLINDLRQTVRAAENSMNNLDAAINDARPGLQAFSRQTIPEIGQLIRDLRQMSESLSSVAQRLDQQGATGLVGQPRLPDYEPEN